jgi:hypothetical protein
VAKVLCVLYEDPVDGYPSSYARDAIPRIEHYYDGQTTPTPERIDFAPGELLGSVSGELGLRQFLEERGHAFVVTSDKDGPDSVFEQELPDAAIDWRNGADSPYRPHRKDQQGAARALASQPVRVLRKPRQKTAHPRSARTGAPRECGPARTRSSTTECRWALGAAGR